MPIFAMQASEAVSRNIVPVEGVSEVSQWHSAWHPAIFTTLRQDAVVVEAIDNPGSGGGVQIEIEGDHRSELEEGQTIYYSHPTFNNNYTITFVDPTLSGGNTIILIDAEELGTSTAGYINFIGARTSYLVEVDVRTVDEDGEETSISDSFLHARPNSIGLVSADIQAWLQAVVYANIEFSYNIINRIHEGLGRRYTIRCREYWREQGAGEWIEFGGTYPLCVTNSVAKVGDKYGQNNAEDVPFGPYVSTSSGNTIWDFTLTIKPTLNGSLQDIIFTNGDPDDDVVAITGISWKQDYNGDAVVDADDLTDMQAGDALRNDLMVPLDLAFGAGNYSLSLSNFRFDGGFIKVDCNLNIGDSHLRGVIGKYPTAGSIVDQDAIEISDIEESGFYSLDVSTAWHKGNFLTMFERPVYFEGYPYALFFMYNSQVARWDQFSFPEDLVRLHRVETTKTINMVQVAQTKAALSYHPNRNNSLMLSAETFASNVKYVAVTLKTHLKSDTNLNGFLSVPERNAFLADNENDLNADGQMTTTDDDMHVELFAAFLSKEVMNELTVEINRECADNAVYLRWLNPKGGQDYWLFKRVNTVSDQVDNEETFEEYIEDLSEALARKEVTNKDVQEEINIGADLLTIQQAEGLRYLLRSVKVEMYMGEDDDDNPIFHTVRVRTGRFPIYNKPENKASIELSILPPQPFNQQQ